MAQNVIKLLEDDVLYSKISKLASEQAARFNISNILPQYENLYYNLLSSL